MPPRSPLSQRFGLDAAWLRTPDRQRDAEPPWQTMAQWLTSRLPADVDVSEWIGRQTFVYENGAPVGNNDAYQPHTFVWFHRPFRDEPHVPGTIHRVYEDDRILVVDKPAFLASIPRGRHILQSVVARLRQEMDLPELTPAHRLDRVTSGLLLLTKEPRWRHPYQSLFQDRRVQKTYYALAARDESLSFPLRITNHIDKKSGDWRAQVIPDRPANAETIVVSAERRGDMSQYELMPVTGRTHQLRLHMAGLGLPIAGDPLYPDISVTDVDDFSAPLQLLAAVLQFDDPVTGQARDFRAVRQLPIEQNP